MLKCFLAGLPTVVLHVHSVNCVAIPKYNLQKNDTYENNIHPCAIHVHCIYNVRCTVHVNVYRQCIALQAVAGSVKSLSMLHIHVHVCPESCRAQIVH